MALKSKEAQTIPDDLLDDVEQGLAPSDESVRSLSELAQRQLDIEAEIATIEEQLAKKRDELRIIAEDQLPTAMLTAGVESMKLANGAKVEIKEDLSISVTKPKLPYVLGWLRKNKHADIIKRDLETVIPKGKDSEGIAKKAIAALKKLKLDATVSESVHSGTLKALLREQLAKGAKGIELDKFGAFQWKKSVITLPEQTNTEEKF